MKLTTVPEYLKAIANGPLSQPDGVTCQSTCICAVTGGTTPIEDVRAALFELGNPGSPDVMGQYLTAHFGDRYSYHPSASINDMRSYIEKGSVLIVHNWLTGSGHVICLDGEDESGFRVMDPWEEFEAYSWTYPLEMIAFQGVYSEALIYAACVYGESRDDAHRIYLERGKVDRSLSGAWVHQIKPGVI